MKNLILLLAILILTGCMSYNTPIPGELNTNYSHVSENNIGFSGGGNSALMSGDPETGDLVTMWRHNGKTYYYRQKGETYNQYPTPYEKCPYYFYKNCLSYWERQVENQQWETLYWRQKYEREAAKDQ